MLDYNKIRDEFVQLLNSYSKEDWDRFIKEDKKLNQPIRYECMLCGRDKFTHKSPHKCNTGFRKRNIVWRPIYN